MITDYINMCIVYIFMICMISGCINRNFKTNNNTSMSFIPTKKLQTNIIQTQQVNLEKVYDTHIHRFATYYGVDEYLIKAIIQVESNYNPTVVSKSNAVGLMQLKADTAGRDAYRLKGWTGQPSICDLKNGVINIELGVAYLSILQKQLEGIINMETKRYALIVSYVNGLGALLNMFSINRILAIQEINKFDPDQFYTYIQYNHPSKQAQRYLSKVNSTYILFK